ncbi:MAG: hypothetical protein HY718_04785 [Planctomycetes bacterium]|nr:hypothetical protein [Planctomycetota bacterium]
MKRFAPWILAVVVPGSAVGAALGASSVRGRMTSDGVTGRLILGHGWTEEKIFISPTMVAYGASAYTQLSPPGRYQLDGNFPAGDHMLFTIGYDSPVAFSYLSTTLPGGTTIVDPVELRTPAHYSVAYNSSYTEWGTEPWKWGSSFFQTFLANQQHITRLATKLAGKSGDHYSMTLLFAIYQPNAGLPSTWQQISPTRSYFLPGSMDPIIHILWVPYRSSEVTLTVGQTYALRLWVAPGSQATSFAIVTRPDDGGGYSGGRLYVDDVSYPGLDGYAYVSGGTPGTIVNHAPLADLTLPTLAGWSTRFGQTFRASGTSLAGAEIVYATGDYSPPALRFDFQVYTAVGGSPIGPSRTSYGVPGVFQARAAAAWVENEVPLTPGQMYYIEWTPPASGCNTWYMTESVPGEGYVNRVALAPPQDLMMAIAEYQAVGPTIGLSQTAFARTVVRNAPVTPDTFTIRNTGIGTINYTLSTTRPWLTVDPASGASTGEEDTRTVNYDTSSLLPGGPYSGTITVADPNATNSPQTIAVALTVKSHPGDLDDDNDVDLEDWGYFQMCYTGPGIAQPESACQGALLDGDTDVDLADAEIFVQCLSGPGVASPVGCDG